MSFKSFYKSKPEDLIDFLASYIDGVHGDEKMLDNIEKYLLIQIKNNKIQSKQEIIDYINKRIKK